MTMQSSGLKVYLIVLEEKEGSESELILYRVGHSDQKVSRNAALITCLHTVRRKVLGMMGLLIF